MMSLEKRLTGNIPFGKLAYYKKNNINPANYMKVIPRKRSLMEVRESEAIQCVKGNVCYVIIVNLLCK
jgi:hypothetical protein